MSILSQMGQQTATTPEQAQPSQLGASQPNFGAMTLDDVLGINADDASLMEGQGLWPAGKWVFQLTDIETDTYEIKQEESPRVGTEAPIIRFVLTCREGMAGTAKDGDGKLLNQQQVAEWVDKEFKESVMFGNDGLPNPKKPDEIKFSGRDKMFTLMHHFIGEDAYEKLKAECGGNAGQMLQQLAQATPMFACEVSHNVNPNDPNKRKNHQLNLFGEFIPVTV